MASANVATNRIVVQSKATPIVEYKTTWAADWTPLKYAVPIRAVRRASPSISTAELVYQFGLISREDHKSSYARYAPLSLKDAYLRISIVSEGYRQPLWTGIVTDEAFDLMGPVRGITGDQSFQAQGLEHLLDRTIVQGAVVKQADMIGSEVLNEIAATHDFNRLGRWGDSIIGNRTTEVDVTHGVHLFSSDGAAWTNQDVVRYLLKFFQPAGVLFVLAGETALLESITTVHRLEGLTVKQCLDRLIDRHRGLSWTVREVNGVVTVHVFSTFGQPIEVDAGVLAPNPEQYRVILDDRLDVKSAIATLHHSMKYDRVDVVGDLFEVCFSAGIREGSLKPDWTAEKEVDYKINVESEDTNDNAKNDEARRGDKHEDVYQRFVIDPAWNGFAHDGSGGSGDDNTPLRTNCIPLIMPDGLPNTDEVRPIFPFGRTLVRSLPFYMADSREYMPSIAIVRDPEDTLKWIQLDKTNDDAERPAAGIRVLDDAMGVLIKPRINHILGLDHFDESEIVEGEPVAFLGSDVEPVYRYEDIIATINMQLDQRLRVIRLISGTPSENTKTLRIEVEGAKSQYVNPNTSIRVEEGLLVLHDGGLVRDDSPRLRLIAALAAAWYAIPRSSIQVTLSGLLPAGEVGQYITEISSAWQHIEAGTPVTSIGWDFSRGAPKTMVETGFWELDAAKIFEMPNHQSPRQIARDFRELKSDIAEIRQRVTRLPDREPIATGGGGGTGGESLPPHSHEGHFDGGFAGFLSGDR